MATSILPGGHSHFDHTSQFYPQTIYQNYPRKLHAPNPLSPKTSQPTFLEQNTVSSASHSPFTLPNAQDNLTSLSSAQTWSSQAGSRRASSKSPNAQERTPIRHNRLSQSRGRSISGNDALLAYATEQGLQQQQQQQPQQSHQQPNMSTPPMLQQTTPISSPALFSSQPFASISSNSPYMPQQSYYDNATSTFVDLQNQHVSHGISDFYPLTRSELHTSPMNVNSLNPQDALYMQQAGQTRQQALPSMSTQALNFPTVSRPLESIPGSVEVSSSRNKPQCWDHGCNGRQFSTFSNLLRHQREKSGTAAKARCPHCGTEFTRTTARNGHMYGGKCKGMPDGSKRSSISESVDNDE